MAWGDLRTKLLNIEICTYFPQLPAPGLLGWHEPPVHAHEPQQSLVTLHFFHAFAHGPAGLGGGVGTGTGCGGVGGGGGDGVGGVGGDGLGLNPHMGHPIGMLCV